MTPPPLKNPHFRLSPLLLGPLEDIFIINVFDDGSLLDKDAIIQCSIIVFRGVPNCEKISVCVG